MRSLMLCCCAVAALGLAPAEAREQPARRILVTSVPPPAADAVLAPADAATAPESLGRLQRLLRDAMARTRTKVPQWVRYREGDEVVDSSMAAGHRSVCLVLQEARPDGIDLLTARFTLLEHGRVRAFAGAGLNRTTYFYDDPTELGPSRLDHRHRDRDYGAAAELGAELRLSGGMYVSAEARWIELDDRAVALRGDDGPVAAEPLTFGLAVGYRFR